ncbi:uncharacterized protein LOC114956487 isoform X2 [Acropora millepora]|uniref:uncharacterized protein LOC114956487 isoform X2 n=1 Tax=Acropora millepora TaxID=45264 RepID=UPI001CF2F2C6|nr:uncharacterized protein LOC114956487 isoform X2 [Acropora millepora]
MTVFRRTPPTRYKVESVGLDGKVQNSKVLFGGVRDQSQALLSFFSQRGFRRSVVVVCHHDNYGSLTSSIMMSLRILDHRLDITRTKKVIWSTHPRAAVRCSAVQRS